MAGGAPSVLDFRNEHHTILRIMKLTVSLVMVLAFVAVPSHITAQSNRRDVSEDSHYSVVYENSRVRVITLELPRLASTNSVCNKSAYLSIVTTPSQTTSTREGYAGIRHEWNLGEARFHYTPYAVAMRNENDTIHREVLIETSLKADYNPLNSGYDTDEFPADLRSVKATTSNSFSRGALTAIRVQLAPGETFPLSETDHVVIALTEISLTSENGKNLDLGRSDVTILTLGRINSLKNTSKTKAQFMVVDF